MISTLWIRSAADWTHEQVRLGATGRIVATIWPEPTRLDAWKVKGPNGRIIGYASSTDQALQHVRECCAL